jgi:hypothetical protein
MKHPQMTASFPRRVKGIVLEFHDWASEVRQQMMNCLRKSRTEQSQALDQED